MIAIQLTIFSTIVTVATVLAKNEGFVKLVHDFDISEKKISKSGVDSAGEFKGLRSCGGQSKAVQLRYETCVDTDAVCHLPTDGVARFSELDFVPSRDIKSQLGLRFNIQSTDDKINIEYDYGAINSKVLKSGRVYTIRGHGVAGKELKGKHAVGQYIVYDVKDKHVEVCAEVDVIYI